MYWACNCACTPRAHASWQARPAPVHLPVGAALLPPRKDSMNALCCGAGSVWPLFLRMMGSRYSVIWGKGGAAAGDEVRIGEQGVQGMSESKKAQRQCWLHVVSCC